jgi:hypothetical protein
MTLTYALTLEAKSVSDDMALIWIGTASRWLETIRAAWDKNKILESNREIMAEPYKVRRRRF